jgi:hypothetical protein
MTTRIDQRITSAESELSALASKITSIEAVTAALPAKLRRLEEDAMAFNLRVAPLEQQKADVDARIAELAGGLTALQNPPPPPKSLVDIVNAWAEPVGKMVISVTSQHVCCRVRVFQVQTSRPQGHRFDRWPTVAFRRLPVVPCRHRRQGTPVGRYRPKSVNRARYALRGIQRRRFVEGWLDEDGSQACHDG